MRNKLLIDSPGVLGTHTPVHFSGRSFLPKPWLFLTAGVLMTMGFSGGVDRFEKQSETTEQSHSTTVSATPSVALSETYKMQEQLTALKKLPIAEAVEQLMQTLDKAESKSPEEYQAQLLASLYFKDHSFPLIQSMLNEPVDQELLGSFSDFRNKVRSHHDGGRGLRYILRKTFKPENTKGAIHVSMILFVVFNPETNRFEFPDQYSIQPTAELQLNPDAFRLLVEYSPNEPVDWEVGVDDKNDIYHGFYGMSGSIAQNDNGHVTLADVVPYLKQDGLPVRYSKEEVLWPQNCADCHSRVRQAPEGEFSFVKLGSLSFGSPDLPDYFQFAAGADAEEAITRLMTDCREAVNQNTKLTKDKRKQQLERIDAMEKRLLEKAPDDVAELREILLPPGFKDAMNAQM